MKKYNGSKKYVMHFDKGQLPPVDGFWSLTMYDKDYFFVDNPLNRYTLSQRNKLKANADGSVDLYIQDEVAGHGQGIELAARAEGRVHPDDAAVLAEGEAAVDHRRHLEDPRGERGIVAWPACNCGLWLHDCSNLLAATSSRCRRRSSDGVPVRPGRNRSFTARPPAPIAEYPVSKVKQSFGRLFVERPVAATADIGTVGCE